MRTGNGKPSSGASIEYPANTLQLSQSEDTRLLFFINWDIVCEILVSIKFAFKGRGSRLTVDIGIWFASVCANIMTIKLRQTLADPITVNQDVG
jgi:hypothetical protein